MSDYNLHYSIDIMRKSVFERELTVLKSKTSDDDTLIVIHYLQEQIEEIKKNHDIK